MKKSLLFSIVLLSGIMAKAQESDRKFEFGSTVLTVNSLYTSRYYIPERPPVEYLNALFFRYTQNRVGFRGLMSYSENSYSYEMRPGVADGSSGNENKKDFRIGIGMQYSILKKKDLLYTCFDILYRNVYATGHYYGGIWGASDRITKNTNGLDNFLGLGLKIKTIKNVYLSPEFGFNASTQFGKKTTTSMYRGESYTYSFIDFYLNPQLKLHLTVKF